MSMNPFAVEYYAEAQRLLEGIREMLPAEQGVAVYGPTAAELLGKLVVAPTLRPGDAEAALHFDTSEASNWGTGVSADAGEDPRAVAGILRHRDGAYQILDRRIDPDRTRPVTREDIDLLQDALLDEGSGPESSAD
jgi:hypothetical protein